MGLFKRLPGGPAGPYLGGCRVPVDRPGDPVSVVPEVIPCTPDTVWLYRVRTVDGSEFLVECTWWTELSDFGGQWVKFYLWRDWLPGGSGFPMQAFNASQVISIKLLGESSNQWLTPWTTPAEA